MAMAEKTILLPCIETEISVNILSNKSASKGEREVTVGGGECITRSCVRLGLNFEN